MTVVIPRKQGRLLFSEIANETVETFQHVGINRSFQNFRHEECFHRCLSVHTRGGGGTPVPGGGGGIPQSWRGGTPSPRPGQDWVPSPTGQNSGERVLATWRAVCFLRSRRRTFFFVLCSVERLWDDDVILQPFPFYNHPINIVLAYCGWSHFATKLFEKK